MGTRSGRTQKRTLNGREVAAGQRAVNEAAALSAVIFARH